MGFYQEQVEKYMKERDDSLKVRKKIMPYMILLSCVFSFMMVGNIAMWYGTWYDYNYQLSIPANAHFLNAKYTNNIDIVILETKKGMAYYEDYHGNVAIIFPTPQKEWDYYRIQINEVLDQLNSISKNTKKGDDAYDEALDAGKTSLYMYYNGEDSGDGLVDKFARLLGAHLYKQNWIFMWSWGISFSMITFFFIVKFIYFEINREQLNHAKKELKYYQNELNT